MKPQFWRRQGYLDEREDRSCRNTRGRPFRGVEAVELALFLDSIGFRSRLMLGGSRLTKIENGDVAIERKPKRTQRVNRKSV